MRFGEVIAAVVVVDGGGDRWCEVCARQVGGNVGCSMLRGRHAECGCCRLAHSILGPYLMVMRLSDLWEFLMEVIEFSTKVLEAICALSRGMGVIWGNTRGIYVWCRNGWCCNEWCCGRCGDG